MPGVSGCQSESGQSIRDDIRCGSQILTARRRKVHNTLDTVKHISRFPSCHCHVVHGFCGFGCGEFCLCTHFTGFISQVLQLITGRTGYSGDLAHGSIKIRCRFHSGSTGGENRYSHMGSQCLAHIGDFAADLFERFSRLTDFHKSLLGFGCLRLQILKLLLGLDDLTLKGIVLLRADRVAKLIGYILSGLLQRCQLVRCFLDLTLQSIVLLLRDLTFGKLLIGGFRLFLQFFQLVFGLTDLLFDRIVFCLPSIIVVFGFGGFLAGFFQGIQSFLCTFDSISEELLLLSKQLCIFRIELQQLFDVFELCLRVLDVLIYVL
ncbi:MAG: hypothetical protein BWZ04_03005 [Firmicutes bacterium ADurb.BinA205]|nr:MAG: hypothetical protein BWZ04_03005 [Firmicutes bacterium ADurb.BinA205]